MAGWGRTATCLEAGMDQTYLLILGAATLVAVGAGIKIRARMVQDRAEASPAESPFAVSTEICPNCGMGNLWTERKCSACGRKLQG
jgi:hypothetical protein